MGWTVKTSSVSKLAHGVRRSSRLRRGADAFKCHVRRSELQGGVCLIPFGTICMRKPHSSRVRFRRARQSRPTDGRRPRKLAATNAEAHPTTPTENSTDGSNPFPFNGLANTTLVRPIMFIGKQLKPGGANQRRN